MALLGAYGILTEASLSFLGVGDPNVVSLGQMLTNGLESATTAWWVPAFPGGRLHPRRVLERAGRRAQHRAEPAPGVEERHGVVLRLALVLGFFVVVRSW